MPKVVGLITIILNGVQSELFVEVEVEPIVKLVVMQHHHRFILQLQDLAQVVIHPIQDVLEHKGDSRRFRKT
jgi:hypothetical protein